MDDDDETVFDRTVEWAISQGIETATFHLLTPYPDTELRKRMEAQRRILHNNWDLYDTRHVVYRPAKLTPEALEAGYWKAYRDFYQWGSIFRGAWAKDGWVERLRHVAYAGGWKKFEPMWDWVIRVKRVTNMLPILEGVLAGFGRHSNASHGLHFGLPEALVGQGVGVAVNMGVGVSAAGGAEEVSPGAGVGVQ
jgi:radical SAM superfamily enzyme YgiQ (UPF0313 family)